MSGRYVIALVIAAGLIACAKSPSTSDDVAVLRAALEKTCSGGSIRPAVISDEPATYRNYSLPAEWPLTPEYERLLSDQPVRLTRWKIGEVCKNARVVTQHDIDATFANDPRDPPGWEKFHETFKGAGGYSAYSRPTYSNDGTHALVFFDYHCEGLAGTWIS